VANLIYGIMLSSALRDCGKPQNPVEIVSVAAKTPNQMSQLLITDRRIPSGQT